MRATSSLVVLLLVAAATSSLLAACKGGDGSAEGQWRPSGIDAGIFGASPLEVAKKASQAEMDKHKLEKIQLGFVKDAEQVCKTDADCVLTTRYCCGCAANGAMVGVHRDELQNVLYRRVVGCKDHACAQVMSADPSCEAPKAVCRERKCVPDVAPGAKAPAGVGVEPIRDDAAPAPTPVAPPGKPAPKPAPAPVPG